MQFFPENLRMCANGLPSPGSIECQGGKGAYSVFLTSRATLHHNLAVAHVTRYLERFISLRPWWQRCWEPCCSSFGKQENIPALKWWGTAYLLGACSVALWTVAGNALGEMFSLALNASGFLACGMVWNASRVFHGRKPNLPGLGSARSPGSRRS